MDTDISYVTKMLYEKREKYANLSMQTKNSIDSFLCFSSFVTKDEKYYPFWATLDFGNCCSFVSEYVCLNWDMFPSHKESLEWLASNFILENRDYVWNFFKNFPTFELWEVFGDTKYFVLNPILAAVIGKTCSEQENRIVNGFKKSLFKLAACDEFFQYCDNLSNDLETMLSHSKLPQANLDWKTAEQFIYNRKEALFRKLKNILEPYR